MALISLSLLTIYIQKYINIILIRCCVWNKDKPDLSTDRFHTFFKIGSGKHYSIDTGLRCLLLFGEIVGLEKGRLF